MIEKEIYIKSINPIEIYGVNNVNLEIIKKFFPKLKIIARGNTIKLIGNDDEISCFEKKINLIIRHYEKFGKIAENDIIQLINSDAQEIFYSSDKKDDVLLYGVNGTVIKARTINQRIMVKSCEKNDLVFVIGPAGTGKTYTAVALAVRALKNKEVKRIILTRPAVEAGENLGFLPGDLREKLDPYMQPLYDALRDMIPPQKLRAYIEDGIIEIAPLAFMRGRTLNNVFAILDEAQNTTKNQIKMFLTRMGKTAKFIITGDITQIDLPKNQSSGLIHTKNILQNINGIDFVFLNDTDIIRHKLVTKIVNAYDKEK
jgi:phosphate starvation-inducible PhoH-like protein